VPVADGPLPALVEREDLDAEPGGLVDHPTHVLLVDPLVQAPAVRDQVGELCAGPNVDLGSAGDVVRFGQPPRGASRLVDVTAEEAEERARGAHCLPRLELVA
jgi:hypothetical protein